MKRAIIDGLDNSLSFIDLTQAEIDELAATQAAIAAKKLEEPKILDLAKGNAASKHFHNILYDVEVTTLYPKRTFQFGAVTNVKWYSDSGLTDLIINVDIAYNYDALGFATDRTTTRTWYDKNGNPLPETKVTYKDYTINPQDQLEEAVRRRHNIVSQTNVFLIGAVPGLTLADTNVTDRTALDIRDAGISFFETYETEKSAFESTGSTNFENIVKDLDISLPENVQYDWFDADATSLGIPNVSDVRDYIIYQLSSGLRNKNGTIT
jgi:hypothetical protein